MDLVALIDKDLSRYGERYRLIQKSEIGKRLQLGQLRDGGVTTNSTDDSSSPAPCAAELAGTLRMLEEQVDVAGEHLLSIETPSDQEEMKLLKSVRDKYRDLSRLVKEATYRVDNDRTLKRARAAANSFHSGSPRWARKTAVKTPPETSTSLENCLKPRPIAQAPPMNSSDSPKGAARKRRVETHAATQELKTEEIEIIEIPESGDESSTPVAVIDLAATSSSSDDEVVDVTPPKAKRVKTSPEIPQKPTSLFHSLTGTKPKGKSPPPSLLSAARRSTKPLRQRSLDMFPEIVVNGTAPVLSSKPLDSMKVGALEQKANSAECAIYCASSSSEKEGDDEHSQVECKRSTQSIAKTRSPQSDNESSSSESAATKDNLNDDTPIPEVAAKPPDSTRLRTFEWRANTAEFAIYCASSSEEEAKGKDGESDRKPAAVPMAKTFSPLSENDSSESESPATSNYSDDDSDWDSKPIANSIAKRRRPRGRNDSKSRVKALSVPVAASACRRPKKAEPSCAAKHSRQAPSQLLAKKCNKVTKESKSSRAKLHLKQPPSPPPAKKCNRFIKCIPKNPITLKAIPPTQSATFADLNAIPVFSERTLTRRGINHAGSLQEPHKKIVYCTTWSSDFALNSDGQKTVLRYLATCGNKYLTIYEVAISDHQRGAVSGPFTLKQSFVDEDDDFYTCAFVGRSPSVANAARAQGNGVANNPQLLCVGGKQHYIHVIDIVHRKLVFTLQGHGDEILDLKSSPVDEWILLSCSVDESIRLWNLKTGTPVAILTGRGGHREHVVSADWHPSGNRIVSSGMDTTVKVWDVGDGSVVQQAIAESHEVHRKLITTGEQIHFRPVIVESAMFSTNKVHVHCVDCVEFVGNLILSKSVDSVVELWYPILTRDDDEDDKSKPLSRVIHLHSFHYDKGDAWYMRFATDSLKSRLAVGDIEGKVWLWELGERSHRILRPLVKIMFAVRGLAFSPCGNVLVATYEDGTVYKWDVRKRR